MVVERVNTVSVQMQIEVEKKEVGQKESGGVLWKSKRDGKEILERPAKVPRGWKRIGGHC